MNYFDYNANKSRPVATPSKASFEVIEPPEFWVAEHGQISEDTWEQVKITGELPR